MKQFFSPSNYRTSLQQITLESPKSVPIHFNNEQKTATTNEYGHYLKNRPQNNSFASATPTPIDIKHMDFKALALGINFCLSNQSKMAEAIGEIGLCLRDLTSDPNASSGPSSRKQVTLQHSSSMNNSLIQSKEKNAKAPSIQAVISKLDALKREIASKISEFEHQLQNFDIKDAVSNKNPLATEEQISFYLPSKFKFTTEENVKSNLQSKEETEIMQCTLNDYPDRFNSISSDLQGGRPDSLNEISNMGKALGYTDTGASTDNSRAKTATPQNATTFKLEKPFEKKATTHIHLTEDISAYRDSIALKTQETPKNMSAGKVSSTANLKSAKSKETASTTKSMYEAIQSQLNQKKHQKQLQIQVQLSPKTELKVMSPTQSSKISRKSAIVDHRRMISVESTPMNGLLRMPNSPKEEFLENGQRKNCIKPQMNVIPQKQVIDESLRDQTVDQTMQGDKSMCNPSENNTHNITQEERPHSPGTNRAYSDTKNNEIQEPMLSFLRNIARKEKALIKNLMKEEKNDNSKMNQRKFLINAKWWRTWKEFVNFDSEDTLATSSLFEMTIYPRPGPINNRELLREDAVSDLSSIVPELELKENLLEHHDYIGVNKKVYDVLAHWYGSDFEICRVLKPDPFQENKSYLELYPKRRLMRANQKSFDANNGMVQNDIINSIIQSNLAQN